MKKSTPAGNVHSVSGSLNSPWHRYGSFPAIFLFFISFVPLFTSAQTTPVVSSVTAAGITTSDALSGGNVTSDGGDVVTARGIAYGLNTAPGIAGTITTDGSGTGIFTSSLTGLAVNTQYFYRAYATNSVNTGYGAENNFYTLANVPGMPVISGATSSSLDITVTANGNPAGTEYAIQDAGSTNYVQADGSIGENPAWQTAAAWGTKTITGLASLTQYDFQVKARNGDGLETAFGSAGSGTTLEQEDPLLSASSISAFGTLCINNTLGPLSSTITGMALTTADITVGPMPGYSFSIDGTTYTSSVTFVQPGGAFSGTVFIKFTPAAAQSYDGNILIVGGGAPAIAVAASGTGINTIANAGVVNGASALCINATTQYTNTGNAGGAWTSTNTAVAIISNTGQVTALNAGTTDITYTVNGCSSSSSNFKTLTISPNANAGIISGNASMCTGTTSSYSTTGNSGTWSSSNTAVATVTSAGLVRAITAGSATISYTVSTGCMSPSAAFQPLTVSILPATPGTISGPVNACSFIGQAATANYSIAAVANATSYTWTMPAGASVVSGQGSTSIEVSYSASFASGSIKVAANSNCGARAPKTLSVTKTIPAVPGAISGPASACPYINTGISPTYSIAAVANAASYTWTVPANVSIVSGQGTTDLTVTFNSGYTSGTLKVKSVSNCGNSSDRSLTITASTYGTPGTITGPANVCSFIGVSDAAYTIRKVTNASAYIWTVPSGASISSHPGGSGINDTIITVTFTGSIAAGSQIAVQAAGCVPSAARTLALTRNLPSTPGTITGSANACEAMTSASNPSGTPLIYTIRKVVNATSYSWTAPSGATITAHPAGSGINDTIVELTYGAGFTTGSLSVAAANGCGSSATRSLTINRLATGTAGPISFSQIITCPSRQFVYSLPAMPSNATSVNWTIPVDGTLVSGQGTTSITVSYPPSAFTGNVTATPSNNCTVGTTRTLAIKLSRCNAERWGSATLPVAQVRSINIEQPVIGRMEVKVFPNPAISDFKVRVITADKEPVHVRILDISGAEVKSLLAMPNEDLVTGNDLRSGTYILEVTQGKNKTTQKLLKF